MPARLKYTLLFLLLVASISCQAIHRVTTSATPYSLKSAEHAIQQASPTLLPPTLTPTSTPTLFPTPTQAPSQRLAPLNSQSLLNLRIFLKLWQTVKDNYLYPDLNGLDWDKVFIQYRQRIENGLTQEEFYQAMEEMITLLNDDHSFFLSPEAAKEEDTEFAGQNDYVGIGILSYPYPERNRIVVVLTFPDSPAEQAGIKPHDSILEADGVPIFDENGLRRDLLRGPAGTEVVLTAQSPGEATRQIRLVRKQIQGAIPVPWTDLESPGGKRIGYLLLSTFIDEKTDDQVAEAMQRLSSSGELDGLIIDNRQNTGGADDIARQVLSYFTRGSLGHFVDRDGSERPLTVVGNNINNSQEIPLVILVGPNTVSFGEIFSGVLQDVGRAYLIGETTPGNLELLWGFDFEDGSRVWIAREAFHPLNHPQQNWEDTGIIPNLTVPSNWDEVTLTSDPAIQAALNHLDARQ